MKARIEKKVSKALKIVAPVLFNDSWVDAAISERSFLEGNSIANCERIGGELDCWGEGTDDYSLIEFMQLNYYMFGNFPPYPQGHEFEGMPDVPKSFKPTTINLIKIAKAFG